MIIFTVGFVRDYTFSISKVYTKNGHVYQQIDLYYHAPETG